MHNTYLCVALIPLFSHISCVCATSIHVLLFALQSFMRHSYLRVTLIYLSHSFMCHFYLCIALIYVLHSSICCTYQCVAPIHLVHSFHALYSFNDVSYSFMHCIYLCITLFMYYITFLVSRIRYATYIFLTSFFLLICIMSQTSW